MIKTPQPLALTGSTETCACHNLVLSWVTLGGEREKKWGKRTKKSFCSHGPRMMKALAVYHYAVAHVPHCACAVNMKCAVPDRESAGDDKRRITCMTRGAAATRADHIWAGSLTPDSPPQPTSLRVSGSGFKHANANGHCSKLDFERDSVSECWHNDFYTELIRYVATQYILLVFGVMTSIQDNECLILVFVLTHEDDKFVKVVNCSLCDKVEITHLKN